VLSLDRPFTYELPAELEAGVGSLVRVPFHGRLVRGWVLGPAEEVPARLLTVRGAVTPVRFFDGPTLELLRWVSERYVAPLAAVIARSHPPRVASVEGAFLAEGGGAGLRGGRFADSTRFARLVPSAPPGPPTDSTGRARLVPSAPPGWLLQYRNGASLLEALRGSGGAFVLRPAPEEEVTVALECVGAALERGRGALVLVPEAHPLPATAAALREAFGDAVGMLLGGDRNERYRTWLEVRAGRYACVVGTRPAVFAPVPRLGLVFVSRESHALHREQRAPYYHVRDVALERARILGAVCVASALLPSLETTVVPHVVVEPPDRRWPPVEVVRPGPEGRAPRLISALKGARRGFVFSPVPGYGVARVCRGCGEPAACAACGGLLRLEEGRVRCTVCGADGRCASCGASAFGVARGGAERVEEWARRVASVPVRRIGRGEAPRPPGPSEIVVGGVEVVKDFGPLGLDMVAVLDADLASRRPGLAARERALASWMEAAAWARPGGRVIVQTRHPNDPAVQTLVTGRPERFHRAEAARRAEAGFPVGAPVFRVRGTATLEDELRALHPSTLLVSGLGDESVCLVALDPARVAEFGRAMRALAERGVVSRVEAEPHL